MTKTGVGHRFYACLHMQDTWLVTAGGGEPLAGVPMRICDRSESRPGG